MTLLATLDPCPRIPTHRELSARPELGAPDPYDGDGARHTNREDDCRRRSRGHQSARDGQLTRLPEHHEADGGEDRLGHAQNVVEREVLNPEQQAVIELRADDENDGEDKPAADRNGLRLARENRRQQQLAIPIASPPWV